MADDNLWRVIGSLEGDMRAIKELLTEANSQRREFQGDIRTAVTEIQLLVPMIHNHESWIETTGKPAANGMQRAKWMATGAVGVASLGSSPSWLPKVISVLHSIFP